MGGVHDDSLAHTVTVTVTVGFPYVGIKCSDPRKAPEGEAAQPPELETPATLAILEVFSKGSRDSRRYLVAAQGVAQQGRTRREVRKVRATESNHQFGERDSRGKFFLGVGE